MENSDVPKCSDHIDVRVRVCLHLDVAYFEVTFRHKTSPSTPYLEFLRKPALMKRELARLTLHHHTMFRLVILCKFPPCPFPFSSVSIFWEHSNAILPSSDLRILAAYAANHHNDSLEVQSWLHHLQPAFPSHLQHQTEFPMTASISLSPSRSSCMTLTDALPSTKTFQTVWHPFSHHVRGTHTSKEPRMR